MQEPQVKIAAALIGSIVEVINRARDRQVGPIISPDSNLIIHVEPREARHREA